MKETEELWKYLTEQERAQLLQLVAMEEREKKKWKPLPGPQTRAIESEADILFYGGAGGGGKTDMLLGLAHLHHTKSVIFRRDAKQLQAIEDRAREIYGNLGSYNATKRIWRLNNGAQIEFAGVLLEIDKEKQRGQPRDLYCFDEITGFTKTQFEFIIGWNRTTKEGQRARVVCTGNPPSLNEGYWVTKYWGAWLDKNHPNPASPGELRWYTTIDGKETEVISGEPFEHNGELLRPQSRTFIPARIDDNPYLANSNYKSTLQNLPEPLRSQMLYGDFNIGMEDGAYQVIPSEWVRLAQKRWKERGKPLSTKLNAIGVDVARGGKDKTVISPRYENYFAQQIVHEGKFTPSGSAVAQLVIPHVKDGAVINIDVIGVGSSPYDALLDAGYSVSACNGAEGSSKKDKTGLLGFKNKRAEWLWKLREALDPETGLDLMIPDDPELLSDLCSARWWLTSQKLIQIESKDEIIKRIGRSPDRGDSLVYAFAIVPPNKVRVFT